VVVVLDHFSRRVQGFQVFEQTPDARTLCTFLERTIKQTGAAPRHLISDKESMFTSGEFRGWCRRRRIGLCYGAVGKHGSIAIVERFIRSMKSDHLPPACRDPRLELRPRWPIQSKCASPQAPMDRDGPHAIRLKVRFLGRRRHLPIVSLRPAA